jgi:hypothetical protein
MEGVIMEELWTFFGLSLFPVLGVVLLIGGIIFRRRRKAIIQSCVQTQGILVGNVKRSNSDSTTFHPVVEYMVKGKKFSVEGSVGYGRKKEEGSEVEVMFNPDEPSTAFIVKHYYFAPNGIIALGASFLSMGSLACYVFYLDL